MSDNESVIIAENLSKVFRDFWNRPRVKAVNGISFEVRQGEVFGLLGPNGSGKSTTIKMILGLLHPTKGNLRVMGQSPRNVAAKSRIGYLPEESYLYNYLTAEETLDFYARLFDLSKRERKERIGQLLHMVGLEHTGRRTIGEFSKGMARRIGLASALINDPDLVILDEPTSGLDPLGTRQVKDLILKLAERGKTVLLSSHLLSDVEDVCDRIAILYGGNVRAQGPIRELLRFEDRYQVNLPVMEKPELERVLAALREVMGQEPDLDQPSRNLEQFFLETIAKAREEVEPTSGAGPEADVAEFLAEEAEAATPSAQVDARIEDLLDD